MQVRTFDKFTLHFRIWEKILLCTYNYFVAWVCEKGSQCERRGGGEGEGAVSWAGLFPAAASVRSVLADVGLRQGDVRWRQWLIKRLSEGFNCRGQAAQSVYALGSRPGTPTDQPHLGTECNTVQRPQIYGQAGTAKLEFYIFYDGKHLWLVVPICGLSTKFVPLVNPEILVTVQSGSWNTKCRK